MKERLNHFARGAGEVAAFGGFGWGVAGRGKVFAQCRLIPTVIIFKGDGGMAPGPSDKVAADVRADSEEPRRKCRGRMIDARESFLGEVEIVLLVASVAHDEGNQRPLSPCCHTAVTQPGSRFGLCHSRHIRPPILTIGSFRHIWGTTRDWCSYRMPCRRSGILA